MHKCTICNKRAGIFDETWVCYDCYETDLFKELKNELKGLENLKKTLLEDVEIYIKEENKKILKKYNLKEKNDKGE